MTKTETIQWLGRELTENEDKLFSFLVPVERARQKDKILVACAFLECLAVFLDTPIPQEALNGVYGVSVDELGNESPNVTEKVLRDFSLQTTPSLDETKAVVLLGAQEFAVGRQEHVDADDLNDWLTYISAYGFSQADLLTREQADELKHSEAYSIGVGEE